MAEVILSVIKISFVMSAVIAVLLLFTRLHGKRFTAKCRFVIWCAVILRLCVPFDANLPALLKFTIPAEIVRDNTPAETPDITPEVIEPAPLTTPETPVKPLDTAPDIAAVKKIETENILRAAAIVWLAGAAAFMVWKLAVYNRRARQLIKTAAPAPVAIIAQYTLLCERLHIKRPPELRVSDEAVSPMLLGFFKRTILLPDFDLPDAAFDGVLAHELTHHKRGDLWLKLACLAARALHWFNPFAHIAAEHCNAEMELSCDEAVLAGLDDAARLSYGGVMLDIIKHRARETGELTTQFNPKSSAVRQRLAGILDGGKKRRGVLIIALAVLLCATAGVIIGCSIENVNAGVDETENASAENDEVNKYKKQKININNSIRPLTGGVTKAILDINLPKEWEIRNVTEERQWYHPEAPVFDIYENDKLIASVSYNAFILYPDVPEDRFYHMVYSDFMNSNLIDWDSGYKTVGTNGAAVAAVDKVNVSIPQDGGSERDEYSFSAVLVYDTDLLSYAVISFDRDYSVTDELLEYIARNIKMSADFETLLVTPVTAEKDADKTDDIDLIKILKDKLLPNYRIVQNWIGGGGLDLDFNKKINFNKSLKDSNHELILMNSFKTINRFKYNLKAVFSEDMLNHIVYPIFFNEEHPIVIESEGSLYYDYDRGFGIGHTPDFDRAVISNKGSDWFEVTVPIVTIDDEVGIPYTYKIVKENGNWVMDNDFWLETDPAIFTPEQTKPTATEQDGEKP